MVASCGTTGVTDDPTAVLFGPFGIPGMGQTALLQHQHCLQRHCKTVPGDNQPGSTAQTNKPTDCCMRGCCSNTKLHEAISFSQPNEEEGNR